MVGLNFVHSLVLSLILIKHLLINRTVTGKKECKGSKVVAASVKMFCRVVYLVPFAVDQRF